MDASYECLIGETLHGTHFRRLKFTIPINPNCNPTRQGLFNPSMEATHSLREESDSVKMKPLLRQSQDPVFT